MTTNVDTHRIVTAERGKLSPHIERVNGADLRDSFWQHFDGAAGRFALGKIDAPEFRGIARELMRDAVGTASQQDRDAGAARLWGTGADMAEREPWATMPTDGSGALTLPEKIVYSLIGAACVVALLVMGWTFGVIGGSDADAPAPADTRTPSQVVSDADLITQGGYWTWEVTETCGMRPAAECHATLREVNDAARHYGLKVFEDGSIAPADQY